PDIRFKDFQPAFFRQKQQLGVETKAPRCLHLENRPASLALEQLESALSIVQMQAKQHANHEIKNHPAKLSQPGLVFLDAASINCPGAYNNVRAFSCRQIE